MLFSDLRARGVKSPLADLFANLFYPIFWSVLPSAKSEKKTFHSTRAWVNTMLANAEVIDPMREAILGHKAKTVNGTNYIKQLELEALRKAINKLPAITSKLAPRVWA